VLVRVVTPTPDIEEMLAGGLTTDEAVGDSVLTAFVVEKSGAGFVGVTADEGRKTGAALAMGLTVDSRLFVDRKLFTVGVETRFAVMPSVTTTLPPLAIAPPPSAMTGTGCELILELTLSCGFVARAGLRNCPVTTASEA
jgi:hypothetical protein